MMNRKAMPRQISRKWASLSNSRSPIHLTQSVTQRTLSFQKQVIFALRRIRTMPCLFAANWPLMLLLMRDLSFAFTLSVFLCAERTRDSFIKIAMVRQLPSVSTISIIPASSSASSHDSRLSTCFRVLSRSLFFSRSQDLDALSFSYRVLGSRCVLSSQRVFIFFLHSFL